MYRPKICSIELFRKCCLRCRMCHMWKVKEVDGGLDKELLGKLAEQLEEVLTGEKEVVFSGGEPLLNESIVDIIQTYSQKGFKVGIASNGVLLDKEMAKQLVEAGLKSIQLSFDSSRQETHDFLRGVEGAYEKVLKGAEYLSAYKKKVSICAQTVISGKNISEIIDTIKFVKDDGRFSYISFMAITTPFFASVGDDWQSTEEFSFLWPGEEKLVDLVIDKIIEMKKDGYPIANPISQFELFRNYFHNPNKRNPGLKCNLGDYVLSIDPASDVRLCCFMKPMGNVKKQSLVDMLNSQEVDKLRQEMRNCQRICNTLVNCFFQEN